MAGRPVGRLALAPELAQHLLNNNLLTARDVLCMGPLDLVELLGLTWSDAQQLLIDVAAQVTPPYTTAWEALQALYGEGAALLLTGLPTLDDALRRGLPCGAITELVGPGGVGKSQMAHMMALRAALPVERGGLGVGVVYVDTERRFSAERLAEMAAAHATAGAAPAAGGGGGGRSGGGDTSEHAVAAVLQRVAVLTPGNSAELESMLAGLEHVVLGMRAKLVVVDSIAALARTEYGNPAGEGAGGGLDGAGAGPRVVGSIRERQAMLGRVAAQLKLLAEQLRLVVLVTNQVTTRFTSAQRPQQQERMTDAPSAQPRGGGSSLQAALGAKWAHCVNLRLVLERLHDRRFLKVAKSPSCANVVLEYAIGPAGLTQLPGADLPAALSGNVLDLAIANEVDYGLPSDYY